MTQYEGNVQSYVLEKRVLGAHLTAKRTADRHKGSDYDL